MKNSKQVSFKKFQSIFHILCGCFNNFLFKMRFHTVYSRKLIFFLKSIIFPNTKNLIKVN